MGLFRRSSSEPSTVRIQPAGKLFQTNGKDSILNDALDAGIPFPHSCTVGTCGTCKSKLIRGKVRELTDSAIALSKAELAERYVLPCQSLARGAVELHVADLAETPDHTLVHTRGEIVGQRLLTHDIYEVTIHVDDPVVYTAGQYAELHIPSLSGPRSYSFAVGGADRVKEELTFFIRRTPGGEFTEWLFAGERAGTQLGVVGPFGNLWLRSGAAPILCVAGGSGLAPIKAILEAARDEGVEREIVVVFGARTSRDLYCTRDLEELAEAWEASYHLVPVLSEEESGSRWTGARGLVTEAIGNLPSRLLASCDVYACGPPKMVDAVEAQFAQLRPNGVFHADRFLDKETQGRHKLTKDTGSS